MGIVTWLLLGLAAGVLAKFLMPGKDGDGWIATIVLGIVGALVGGYLGSYLGFGSVSGFDLRSVGVATGGALVVLLVFRLIKSR